MSNSHIKEFIDYYISSEADLRYAILLKGKWGVGKTHIIKNNIENDESFLYLSMYGVTTIEQIEEEIFKQLHPILSSKGVALTAKVCKGILKTSIKLDLDSDGRSESTISSQAPDITLSKYMVDTKGLTLVFDDLERAAIDLSIILGYINTFVEHQGNRVIIIANEEEIPPSSLEQYKKTKEKIIGYNFEITSDTKNALVAFIDELECSKSQAFLRSNIDIIAELYESSKYCNLRNLKHSLRSFERLMSKLDSSHSTNEELVRDLITLNLIFTLEYKASSFELSEIRNLKGLQFKALANTRKGGEAENTYVYLTSKYKGVDFFESILSPSIWVDIIERGHYPTDEIKESINHSKYYVWDTTANWVKLWHYDDLADDQFVKILTQVEQEFFSLEYTELGELIHVFGMLLWFSSLSLYEGTEDDILEQAILHLNHLDEQGLLNSDIVEVLKHESWQSLGFLGKDFSQMKVFADKLKSTSKDNLEKEKECRARYLTSLAATSPLEFRREITINNNSDGFCFRYPVLKYITPSDFVEKLLNSKSDNARTLLYALESRYQIEKDREKFFEEYEWLRKVTELIEQESIQRKGALSGHLLSEYVERLLKPMIELFQNDLDQKNEH